MLFIAEIGLNHNVNLDLCNELIRQAKWAGADIAKFQLGWRDQPDEINHIDKNRLEDLIQICDYYDIEFMTSIFHEKAFELAKEFEFKRYKIASRTLVEDTKLVKDILDLNKETFISLGMWKDKDLPFTEYKNVKYLWCKSMYPTSPWHLKDLPKDFTKTKISGFSDHSIGIEVPLTAIVRGATIIEKHFTLDKSDTTIRDHALSLTPDEYRLMVQLGRNIAKNNSIGV